MSILKSIAGKSVIVTGGAMGLGAATSRYLAAQGMKVAVLDMDEEKGSKIASDIGGIFCKTDVLSEAQVKSAIKKATEANGPLFSVINCAGIVITNNVLSPSGPHPMAIFDKVVGVNLNGTFNVTRLAAEQMAAHKTADGEDNGVIINCASVAGFDGYTGSAAYAASKGGIIALTLPLARELSAYKIRVNAIAPGPFVTPMVTNLPQEAQDMTTKDIPYPHRMGHPDEFAALVHHLLANQYINGEVIRLDGALRLSFNR